MPTIFELFGFPIDNCSPEVEAIRKSCQCPFMGEVCDGGGNRYQTKIKLTPQEPLRNYFNSDVTEVIPGVCSIQTGNEIWVVCPRRLFAAKFNGEGFPIVNQALQNHELELLKHADLPTNTDIGAWTEVSLKHDVGNAQINYHFDYILAPLILTSLRDILERNESLYSTEKKLNQLIKLTKKSGYFGNQKENLADFPILLPDLSNLLLLEVMTASTSGSNTENSTDLRSSFRNAILTSEHKSPGINKRQVWGRMITQLFAKTALAYQWNARTIWLIQDTLLQNIELTTRLSTTDLNNNPQQNINLATMSYQNQGNVNQELNFQSVITGDSGVNPEGNNSFTDILLAKVNPPTIQLLKAILRRKLDGIFRL